MNNVPFAPAHSWSLRFDGAILAGVGDRYAVHVFRSGGGVLRVEAQAERVAVTAPERADAPEGATWQMRRPSRLSREPSGTVGRKDL